MLERYHLEDLEHTFCEYFPIPDASRNSIRNPFSVNLYELEGLTVAEKDKLIEISTDGALKLQFKEPPLPNFWAHLQVDFPELSKRTMIVLMPFAMTYLCERAFSSLIYLKNKYRNCLKTWSQNSEYKFHLLSWI